MPERAYVRECHYLLPPSLDDWLALDHPARFVEAFVEQLAPADQAALGLSTPAKERGAPRYAPGLLCRVWVYGFMTKVRSARALERACQDSIPVRWLAAGQCPDHNTLWRWYVAHRAGMRAIFQESVTTAAEVGLLDLALMAVDGTKVRANAAADRSLTEEELGRLLTQTERAIADLEAQNVTGAEAATPSLPRDLRTKVALRERIKAAQAARAERAAATGTAAAASEPRGNVSDPEARWMKTRRGTVPGYNAQVAVVATRDPEPAPSSDPATTPGRARRAGGRIVVAAQVTTQPSDTHQLVPVVEEALTNLDAVPAMTVADAGYFEGGALATLSAKQVPVMVSEPDDAVLTKPYHRLAFASHPTEDRLICPQGHELPFLRMTTTEAKQTVREYGGIAATCRACPAFGTCTTSQKHGRTVKLGPHDAAIQAQRRSRAEPTAQSARKRRKTLVEAVFGTIKTVLGGEQLTVRGHAKVEAEWLSLVTAYNLRTLLRTWQERSPGDRPTMFAPSTT